MPCLLPGHLTSFSLEQGSWAAGEVGEAQVCCQASAGEWEELQDASVSLGMLWRAVVQESLSRRRGKRRAPKPHKQHGQQALMLD